MCVMGCVEAARVAPGDRALDGGDLAVVGLGLAAEDVVGGELHVGAEGAAEERFGVVGGHGGVGQGHGHAGDGKSGQRFHLMLPNRHSDGDSNLR